MYTHRMPICVSGGSTCNDDRGDVLQPVEGGSYVHHLEHINPDPEYTSPPPNPILLVLPIRYNLPTQRTDRSLVLYVPGGRSDLTRPGVYLMSTKRFFRYVPRELHRSTSSSSGMYLVSCIDRQVVLQVYLGSDPALRWQLLLQVEHRNFFR